MVGEHLEDRSAQRSFFIVLQISNTAATLVFLVNQSSGISARLTGPPSSSTKAWPASFRPNAVPAFTCRAGQVMDQFRVLRELGRLAGIDDPAIIQHIGAIGDGE